MDHFSIILSFTGAAVGALMCVGVLVQMSRHLSHWLFAAGMLALAVESAAGGFLAEAILPDEAILWQHVRLVSMAAAAILWLLFSTVYARGNSGAFLRQWRPILVAAGATLFLLLVPFRGELIREIGLLEGQTGWLVILGQSGFFLYGAHLVLLVLTLGNLERTYRASVGTLRWRIKYMVVGLAVFFGARLYTTSQVLLYSGVNPALEPVNSAALILGSGLIARTLFRAGHFRVDVYPSASLIQSSLTIVLVGIYLLIVGIFAKVVSHLGGDSAFPLKAFFVLISVVVLTGVVLSDRVRQLGRRFVSRHLRRPVHDYRRIWMRFTERSARLINEKDLCREIASLISDTFNALSVTIWLVDRDQRRLVLGGSTFVSESGKTRSEPVQIDSAFVAGLSKVTEPIDLDTARGDFAKILNRCQPDFFKKGGGRIAMPLCAASETLGVVTLGDRVSGVRFSVEDVDLLKCMGEQAASALLNIRLSDKLVAAKEMQAFQTMATFFVHDLKNTASTLSLLLVNLEARFDDPEFRKDALRAVSRSVNRINDLIARLTVLRSGMELSLTPSDLVAVVRKSLGELGALPGVKIVDECRPVPRVELDASQFGKVLVNLILNARDAVIESKAKSKSESQPNSELEPGEIRIATEHADGQVTLSVHDNGCGIDPEFLKGSLFRPFQTTKKRGIGIGLFHTKSIVESHNGRIEVDTRPGEGTTFRVMLPVAVDREPAGST